MTPDRATPQAHAVIIGLLGLTLAQRREWLDRLREQDPGLYQQVLDAAGEEYLQAQRRELGERGR